MVTSVNELLTPRTADAIAAEELTTLTGAGFPVTSWQPGAVPRSLVKADATALAVTDAQVSALARSNFGDTAEGDWLTLWAADRFGVPRVDATYAVGWVVVTVRSGAGPYTLGAGGLLVSDGTRRYRSTNTGNVTVSSSAPTPMLVRAEVAGEGGNVGTSTITSLLSPALAGVTIDNPVHADGTWLDVPAVNAEGDAALLARCRQRWATLGSGFTRDAAAFWCTSATVDAPATTGDSAGCTRVGFATPAGDGSYTVYVAGASGPLGSGGVTAVQANLDAHKPITDTPTVVSATQQTVTVSGTVFFKSASTAGERAAVVAAISALVNALPIGDDIEHPLVDLGAIYAAIYAAVPGRIANVDLTSPSGDTTIAAGHVAVAETGSLSFA